MEKIKIAKAVIKYYDQYLCFQSNSPLKRWEFFGGQVPDGQTDIGFLVQKFKSDFEMQISVGKKFCQVNYFDLGVQYDVSAYLVNVFDESIFDAINVSCKYLLSSELKTLAWQNIDKIIMQKVLEK